MMRKKAARRPRIHLIDGEADTLADLAVGVADRMPQVSRLLLEEIDRATIHAPGSIPSDVVTMNTNVEFVDEASGTNRTVRLVYPGEADIAQGRVSILTLVGSGLIGMREGHTIMWPGLDGYRRKLTILKVHGENAHA